MQTGLSIGFFAEAKKFEHEPVTKKIKFEHGAKVPCSNGICWQLLCTKKAGEHSGFALEMLQQIRIEHRRQNARAQIYAQIYFSNSFTSACSFSKNFASCQPFASEWRQVTESGISILSPPGVNLRQTAIAFLL